MLSLNCPESVIDFLLSYLPPEGTEAFPTCTKRQTVEVTACFFVALNLMQEWAEAFYKSKAWRDCSTAYKTKVGGLCEQCLAQGIYTPAEIVHHKVHITRENINDPMITLSWSNLKAVCRKCHAAEHATHPKRYTVDQDGHVIAME